MSLDKSLIEKFRSVTVKSAYAASKFKGLNDKIGADKAAVDVMRAELNKIDMKGRVVIGEGELDEAPMLYIGEELGTRKGIEIDIAVDPVEGTNFVAKNLPGGIAVLAVSEKNNLFNAPETYMHKLAVGKNIEKGVVDLDYSLEKNLKNLADAKNKELSDLTVCFLDRSRHKDINETLDKFNINKKLITDGDVSGALNKLFFSDTASTAIPPGKFLATKLVPSTGSTAISISIPFLVPNSSPIYNIGASSNSPSPMTTLPFISILFSSALITSTAALSAPILSFNPLNLDAA